MACEHIRELIEYLRQRGIDVWSEKGKEPRGWVNVHCGPCIRTEQMALDPTLNRSGEYPPTAKEVP